MLLKEYFEDLYKVCEKEDIDPTIIILEHLLDSTDMNESSLASLRKLTKNLDPKCCRDDVSDDNLSKKDKEKMKQSAINMVINVMKRLKNKTHEEWLQENEGIVDSFYTNMVRMKLGHMAGRGK